MQRSETSEPSSLVTKIRSPQMHGVEPAIPGILSFQAMFLVSSFDSPFDSTFFSYHSVGTFFSLQMPSLLGPRHCGQLSARAMETSARITRHIEERRITASTSRSREMDRLIRLIAFRN